MSAGQRTAGWRAALPIAFAMLATGAVEASPQEARPAALPAPAAATPKLIDVKGLPVLRLKGSPREMGVAQGRALAAQIKEGFDEFVLKHRCAGIRARYEQIAKRIEREIVFPDAIVAELDGMIEGMKAAGIDLAEPMLKRDFARLDLEVLNSLDHWGLFGCSGFTAWGTSTKDGEVLAARNFDFDVDDQHAIARLGCLFACEPDDGKAFVSLGFPGLIGVVTGINQDGVALFVHVANGSFGGDDEEKTLPLLFITRRLIQECGPDDAAKSARELLKDAHLRNSFLLRIVTPGGKDPPTTVFELDSRGFEEERLPDPKKSEPQVLVATNHFCGRAGQFEIPDSTQRFCTLQEDVKRWLGRGDRAIDPDEAWRGLGDVAQESRIETLHSLVFVPRRLELWIALSGVQTKGGAVVPSTRRAPSHVTLDELLGRS